MDNPEVTMHEQPPRFDVLEKATTAAGIAISAVMRVPAPLKPLADQVIRSASAQLGLGLWFFPTWPMIKRTGEDASNYCYKLNNKHIDLISLQLSKHLRKTFPRVI